jgi:hypothetical protein
MRIFFSKKFWRARPKPDSLSLCRSDLARTGREFYRDPFLTGDFADALRWFFHRASAPRIPPSRLPGCPAPTKPPMRPRIDAISTTVKRPSLRMARNLSISASLSLSDIDWGRRRFVIVLLALMASFSLCSRVEPALNERVPRVGRDPNLLGVVEDLAIAGEVSHL